VVAPGSWQGLVLTWVALTGTAACVEPPDEPVDPFAPTVSWSTGLGARALAVLDEAKAEVALAFPLDDAVGVLDTVGGVFVASAVEVGEDPLALAALDTDADGRRELATANAGDGTLSLVGEAPAGLAVLATARLAEPPKHVAGADLDGDGRQELIVTVGLDDPADSAIEVWRRTAGGLEPVEPSWPLPDAFASAAGDVDGDGDLDVVAVLPGTDEVAWSLNDGAGHLTPAGRVSVCRAPRAAAMLGDEIAVACAEGLARIDPTAPSPAALLVPFDGNAYDIATGDFDDDGRADLAVVDLAHDMVALWFGLPGRRLSAPVLHPVGTDPIALVAADLGADGDLDLIVSAFATRTIDVLENRLASDERTSP